MKKIARIIAFMFVLVLLFSTSALAVTPYDTYTYSIDGEVLKSPDAYVTDGVAPIDSIAIGIDKLGGVKLNNPTDIESDLNGNIYITDNGNNRIVVLNRYYEWQATIDTFVNGDGVEDTFNGPTSTFAVAEGDFKGLYVCDKLNKRIIRFSIDDYSYEHTYKEPQINFADDKGVYTPVI